MKTALYSILGLIGILIIVFLLELFGLGMFKFFEPKRENIKREVYENTKSRMHGIAQDIGKYYQEYQKATSEEKQTIRSVINMRFASVDADKLESPQLQSFLREMRGY